jgi:hypothetical protein
MKKRSEAHREMNEGIPRAARADAVQGTTSFLFKRVSALRLTYQIRLLAFHAFESQGLLVIEVPAQCEIAATLRAFANEYRSFVRIARVD